jgi:hypothetical protein
LAHAFADSDDDGLGIYWDAFLASLSKAVRKELEMELRILVSENWRPRSDWGKELYAKGEAKGRTEGAAEAKAASVITLLEHRGLPVNPALRERVSHCTDLALLERWFRRAITAPTIEEAFAP